MGLASQPLPAPEAESHPVVQSEGSRRSRVDVDNDDSSTRLPPSADPSHATHDGDVEKGWLNVQRPAELSPRITPHSPSRIQVSPGLEVEETPRSVLSDENTFVASLAIGIQRGFRRKMLCILLAQLLLSLGVGFALLLAIPAEIALAFPAQSGQTYGLLCAVVLGLPLISLVRDRHPWNLLATLAWSLLLGVFSAAAQVEGGIFRSYALFVILGSIAVGVFFLMILSSCTPT